tara:strand:- start:16 stop:294 length:279 start_codon:yes stop_codon:yes gene_type:complete
VELIGLLVVEVEHPMVLHQLLVVVEVLLMLPLLHMLVLDMALISQIQELTQKVLQQILDLAEVALVLLVRQTLGEQATVDPVLSLLLILLDK